MLFDPLYTDREDMNMSKKNTTCCPMRKTSIGGQALMEGIMMRGPQTTAMAVRNPRGEIVLEKFPTQTKKRPAICRWPIIRGVLGFIDSMTLGYKCLMRSAEISGIEELEAALVGVSPSEGSLPDPSPYVAGMTLSDLAELLG